MKKTTEFLEDDRFLKFKTSIFRKISEDSNI